VHGTRGLGLGIRLELALSCQCDDYQRCLYYTLAGRGIVQTLHDLE
jgi:hypothetical protein